MASARSSRAIQTKIMGQYTVISSGLDCKSSAYSSGGASPSWPTKCRFSAYIGNCNATVISVLMVSYHNKLEIKDTMVYIIGMEVRFLRRHKYEEYDIVVYVHTFHKIK